MLDVGPASARYRRHVEAVAVRDELRLLGRERVALGSGAGGSVASEVMVLRRQHGWREDGVHEAVGHEWKS